MDYLFENLGDERFQEFCSCLIAKEFPNIQVFPVGQPDGGRDSIVYQTNAVNKEFIVFQVKYVRNPNQEKDIHKWFVDIIDEESEKINKLMPLGAKSYYLLTNVKGTAHIKAGSIDKLNNILEEKIKIPSICWWRDDLCRLFEKDPLFKWSFPEILNGQDIINSVLFNNINENKERRESVLRAYLTDQYEIDTEVKFKQIELQNKLLSLYIDVPIRIKKYNDKNKILYNTLNILNVNNNVFSNENENKLGAAEFLLNPTIQNNIQRILLEGAPGQGKSTISQFICQVHRIRLLNKLNDIDLLPNKFRNLPIRLPFKIDLRDIASWIEKRNPYHDSVNNEFFESIWKNSLESFIIGHIYYHSKLEEFNSTDLIAIFRLSPILFVFDGFDEIANLKVRSDVIDFINKGLNRLSSNSKSIQVLITSRPAAFLDSVGFSIEQYPHFELTDITNTIITEFVEKWISASKINIREATELRKLIKDKLEMPHLKELTKNPMQLAIFISLLRTKGQSLPNKRTALYDSYIDLFFNRESEKSPLVRDKRDLIIEIHQYLAWILHSEAELYKHNGSITIGDLKIKLKSYLENEGHDSLITDQLFDVMKERVCALVSRVQGTFEFEVQPLREYFCAKYLYKSAPHSSAGSIKTGTKPDRFHAILRNVYWQNVVRFFAGCADAGELDMIIQELIDLQNDILFKYTNYPRIITSQILSDYVFTQKPLKMKEVVKIILDGINIGNLINQDGENHSKEPLILPLECGRTEVVNECFSQLQKIPKNDYTLELIGILRNNPQNNLENWKINISKFKNNQLTKWFEFAYNLQLIKNLDDELIFNILSENTTSKEISKRLQILINGNKFDFIDKFIDFKKIIYEGILDNKINAYPRNEVLHNLNIFTLLLRPYIIMDSSYTYNKNITLINYLSRYFIRYFNKETNSEDIKKNFFEIEIKDEIDDKISKFIESVQHLLQSTFSEFKNKLEPWDSYVENARSIFGDNWSINILATIIAGLKTNDIIESHYSGLTDNSISLCKRTRYARLKSGNTKYWSEILKYDKEKLFILMQFFTWATAKTITKLLPEINKIIKLLNENDFDILVRNLHSSVRTSMFNNNQQKFLENKIKDKAICDELKYLISIRFDYERSKKFFYNINIKKISESFEKPLELKFLYLIEMFFKNPSNTKLLKEIKSIYRNISETFTRRYFGYRTLRSGFQEIPFDIAKKIMKGCKEYPQIISSNAERSCRLYAHEHCKKIGEIAMEEKWFDN